LAGIRTVEFPDHPHPNTLGHLGANGVGHAGADLHPLILAHVPVAVFAGIEALTSLPRRDQKTRHRDHALLIAFGIGDQARERHAAHRAAEQRRGGALRPEAAIFRTFRKIAVGRDRLGGRAAAGAHGIHLARDKHREHHHSEEHRRDQRFRSLPELHTP